MAIFRGVGGSGDSSDNSFLQEVTAQANAASASASAASASASAASASASSILNLTAATGAAGTEASYDASTGVLTIPRGDAGVDAVVDNASVSAAGAVMDSDFNANGFMKRTGSGSYTVDTNTYLTSHQDISGKANLSGANFTGGVSVTGGDVGIGTLIANQNLNVFGDITVSGTVDGRDVATDGSKLDGIEANADVTDTTNVTSAGAAMLASSPTFTGTVTAPNLDITHTGNASVTTNIATGGGTIGNTKVLNLGTGYGFGGTTTVNIGSSTANSINTINLNGNVAVSGTINGGTYERTVRTRFQRRGYTNTGILYTLTTSYAQLGSSLRINSGVTTAVENVLDLNINLTFNDINTTNDGLFVVTVDAPNPANETTVNLGTVTDSALGQFSVTGDFTKHFSPYCGLSKNSDGSSAINFSNQQGWAYDPVTNKTTVIVYPYQSNVPTAGDTVYLHPFDWETSGTEINGDEYPIEAYNANGIVHQNQFHQIYLGYYKPERTFKIKAKESSASENIQINRVAGTYSQIIGN